VCPARRTPINVANDFRSLEKRGIDVSMPVSSEWRPERGMGTRRSNERSPEEGGSRVGLVFQRDAQSVVIPTRTEPDWIE
jgi:hypothetical protein